MPPAVPPASELVELALACLASPDPEVRDGIGYEVFVRWLVAGRALDDAEVRRLRGRLLAQLTPGGIPPGESDAVLARSFAALVLSLVAARELAAPTWSDAELEEQVAAAARYAGAELDLRGYLPGRGWAHAAAHTADWIKMLGRHQRLSAGQAERLAAALADLIVRRHGYSLHHGEEDRVVAALRSLIDRGALPAPALDRFLARLAEPIRAGWPSPFDPVLFAAQRNAHAVLAALFTSLSLARAAPAAAALARVRALLER